MRRASLPLVLLAPLALAAQVRAVGEPIAGHYIRTQGQPVTGWAMPHVAEYATANRMDLEKIRKALFPRGLPAAASEKSALLSSTEHIQGDWTHISSGSVMVYELQRVEVGRSAAKGILALYNRRLPPQILERLQHAEWRLALLDSGYAVKADRPFITRVRHDDPGLWDTIYTGLEIAETGLVVRILYAHAGGGGPRDQEFTSSFSLSAGPWRLALVKCAQTIDIYQ